MNYNNYSTEICGHKIEVCLGSTGSCSPWFLDACTEHGINLIISADMHWWMRIDNSDIYSLDNLTDPYKLIDYFEGFKNDEAVFNSEDNETTKFGRTMFDVELKNLTHNEFEYMGFKFEKEESFQEFLNKRKK